MSRSFARKKLESAVITLDSSRMEREAQEDEPEQLASEELADLLRRRGSR
jgi:hypothetical protein